MSTPDTRFPAIRILVVDDNPAIHDDFRKILENETESAPVDELATEIFGAEPPAATADRYQMDSALQGQEGLIKVTRSLADGHPYTLAFVDIRMPPGWNGIETIARLRDVDPDMQFIICTAYSDYSWPAIRRELGPTDNVVILKKPFDTIEVLQLVHALSQKWTLAREVASHIADLDAVVERRTRELRTANERLRAEIAERARAESALLQSQKMEAIGQLAAGIAHDFNNILTIVQGHASLSLAIRHLDPEVSESLREISRAGERAASLTGQLLAFSRKQRLNPKAFDLAATLRQLHALFARVLGENVALNINCAADLPPLFADEQQLEQVLINLAVNARDAMPSGGTLSIGAKSCSLTTADLAQHPDVEPGEFIEISVADSGTGMSGDVLAHLFEPFFTTKEQGKGTGLGLATAYGIVKQHHGWIDVATEIDRGTIFRIVLPSGKPIASPAPQETAPLAKPALRGTETILVVEDEPPVRAVVRGVLAHFGYSVIEAVSGDAALEIWNQRKDEIDLLLTDIVMPGVLSGTALASQLRKERPELPVILTTGYTDQVITDHQLSTAHMELLRKPYKAEALLNVVRASLEPRRPQS